MPGTISFPSLGISVNPSPVAFSIGSKPIYWYGIIIAVGFLLAVFYALRRSDQFGLTQDNIIDMLLCTVPAAIVGLRLYYCLFSWDLYKDDPIRVLYIWEGGLAIYGGVIASVISVIIFTKVKKISTGAMVDIGGLGLLIGQSIGRWGNFMNREAYGAPTDSFFRMGLTDANGVTGYYHPTFLYESVWNAVGFVLLHFLSKRRKFDGQIFIAYLGWYGLGRVMIEGLRMDSLYVPGTNLRISQLVAGLCFLGAAGYLIYCAIFREYDPADLYVNRVKAQKAAAEETASASTAEETAEETNSEETEAPETETTEKSEAPQSDESPEAGEEAE
ncbi:MAG: prolipoprotein diacylglyceryl transferase [Oscillospiraceae bacterium]|nr:prolipoprotein diacylglyceryl transferase [Oscillospiraceae bacterium]